ncbi:sugar phosphate isomerase/epimerase [Bacillaceae bacterium SIJ1]|uniref:sugar phosphate isomerase/epimerase family protein n=1 Tax=Litoribacterium kuwaitense TaxID=1398745 RepID=UPI0013EE1B06|nr:sugar phosphate isomerase/epimerase [Litoribacterium kuwaitense]NGP45240.1 sugar phosphate isomerase/epimerase [Litoribacterium kuwaitense]
MELGLQLYSVREELEKDFLGTLEKVAQIGYTNVELAFHNVENNINIGGMTAKEFKEQLDHFGLKAVSSHVHPIEKVNWRDMIAFNHTIGSSALVCPMKFFKDRDDVLRFCENLNDYGNLCEKEGISFYYHNHFQEFQKFGQDSAFDIMIDNTDPSLVRFEFDTYWALRGGVDPIHYLKKLDSRCDLIHQKDLPAGVSPVNAFERLDTNEPVSMETFIPFSKQEYFTEVGHGVMNIDDILQTAKVLGYAKYVFVEQDLTSLNQIKSVEKSFKHLASRTHFSYK